MSTPAQLQVVLSGSYRRDSDGLKRSYQELLDLGCTVLSPGNTEAVKEVDGFVYMRGEEAQLPTLIESKHLDAIQHADFVWLYAPGGYVGTSAALEVGFANAVGVPVFSRDRLEDGVLHSFVEQVDSPGDARARSRLHVPQPALRTFQNYYRRVAIQRGYERESAQDCLTLMMEEVGELARAIRKSRKLARHGRSNLGDDEAHELSDVFLYVVHMANVLGIDLAGSVQAKEMLNFERYLSFRGK